MATTARIPVRGARRRTARLVALATLEATLLAGSLSTDRPLGEAVHRPDYLDGLFAEHDRLEELEELVEHGGRMPTHQLHRPDAVEASFARESYRPGSLAHLRLQTRTRTLTVQILRTGVASAETRRRDLMVGRAVTRPRTMSGRPVSRIRVGRWPSGLYFARLSGEGKLGFAPFVVRPARLGEHRIAVVLPTYTWQAYNFRDDDGDGRSDTWYADWSRRQTRINRPFLDRGVPPRFNRYELPFLRWLDSSGRDVDVLTDSDLDRLGTGAKLARYALLVFAGHHEYVTRREYDAVTEFRDRGGNLAFLAANNFFWRVDRRGDVLRKVELWRKLGRPEARLIGAQYIANDRGHRRGAWIVRRTPASQWLFEGTGIVPGEAFSHGGIEIDARSPASPPGTQVVAEIPRIYGPRYTAQMTYYETRRGAKVFAAGAFSLAGAVRQPNVQRLLSNLLARLAGDEQAAGGHLRSAGVVTRPARGTADTARFTRGTR